ncbi:hypothetical protein OC844_007958, partial [Tilletia horrida]
MSGSLSIHTGEVLYTTPLPPRRDQFASATPLRLKISGKPVPVFPVYSITYKTTKDNKRHTYTIHTGDELKIWDVEQAGPVPATVDTLYLTVNGVGATDGFVVVREASRVFHAARYHRHLFAQTPASARGRPCKPEQVRKFFAALTSTFPAKDLLAPLGDGSALSSVRYGGFTTALQVTATSEWTSRDQFSTLWKAGQAVKKTFAEPVACKVMSTAGLRAGDQAKEREFAVGDSVCWFYKHKSHRGTIQGMTAKIGVNTKREDAASRPEDKVE